MKPKRILLSLAGCSPYHGSELHVGWVWLCAVAERHEVILLCSNHDLPDLHRAAAEGLMPQNVTIVPTGQPVWRYSKNRFIARLETWKRFGEFNRHAPAATRRILEKHDVDLIHQVTVATWRTGCPLVGLGKPFVWGPIGGAEAFPLQYLSCLSPSAAFLESSRIVSDRLSSANPLTRRTAREAATVIVTNGDTERKLRVLGRKGIIIRCPMLLDVPRFVRIRELAAGRTRNPALLRIFCGGTLEARKGFVLALKALAEIKLKGVPFHYTFGNHGPDGPWAQRMATDLGLRDHVTFLPGLKGEDYLRRLTESDVFLFPSLRDNSPLTLVEAMGAGCVPVVMNANGPGETVSNECGIVIPLSNPQQSVRDLVEALVKCWNSPTAMDRLAEQAVERVRAGFLSSRTAEILDQAYSTIGPTE